MSQVAKTPPSRSQPDMPEGPRPASGLPDGGPAEEICDPPGLSTGFSPVLVSAVVFLLALIPRLTPVWQGFITPDEPAWIFRSIRFLHALEAHRWADTFQIGHPGVITMWVGTLGVWWQRWREATATATHLAWVDRVPWFAPANTGLYPHLAPFLPPARVAMAVLASLGVVGIHALACRLWDRRLALAGAILLALDPFVIGLSGLLHVDALATTLFTLGLLAWLNALATETRVSLRARLLKGSLFALLSGLCAGLGILSKSVSIFIFAAVGCATVLYLALVPALRRQVRRVVLLGVAWLAGVAAAAFGAFPAMWVDPVGVVQRIYGLAGRYGAAAHRITFFRGMEGVDPGPLFYPTVALFRLTPLTLAGLVLALYPLLSGWRSPAANRRRAAPASLWLLAIGFTAFIGIGAKKLDRYLLPVFPALDLLAAAGWVGTVRGLFALFRRRLQSGEPAASDGTTARRGVPFEVYATVLVVLLLVQGSTIISGWPYYLDVYNPLVGGIKVALRTLPVGWGEGLEQVADYLNRQPDATEWVVAGASPVTLGPLFDGSVLSLDESSRSLADAVVISAMDRQIDPERMARLVSGTRLVHTVRAGGREVLWLYETRRFAEADHLARYGAPGDIILCDAPSPFARHAPEGDVQLVTDADETRVVELMNEWSAAHTRLWYLAYPTASPITAPIIRRQLDTHGVRLDEVDLGYVTATLYILPEEPFVEGEDRFERALFQGGLAIVGGTVLPQSAVDGDLRFRLRWRATATPEADFTPFAHLVDERGHVRAAGRGEELLVDERFWPTSYWAPGEGIELDYVIRLPPGLPPGRYRIVIGLTDAQTGKRAPVLDEQATIRGTTAEVLAVDVLPADAPPGAAALGLAQPANLTWGDRIRLLGYDYPSSAILGMAVFVELGWRGLAPFDGDYSVRLSLIAADGVISLEQTSPISTYPTSRWRRGELIHEVYDLALPSELEGGVYTLFVQVLDGGGAPLAEPVALGKTTVNAGERVFELPQPPQYPLDVLLGEGISLLGYDLPRSTVRPGGELPLTLYWRCNAPMETSYTVFAHLLDAEERVQGQRDRVPLGGRAPTSGWASGQIVIDEYIVPVAELAQPGPHRLEVGMYNAQDMVRLPVSDAKGKLMGDRILLQIKVTVQAQPGE